MLRAGPATILCLAALAVVACGASATDEAGDAAEAYVHDFGRRDGRALCGDMTRALKGLFMQAIVSANPQVRGRGCPTLMNLALRSLPPDQVRRFAAARIEGVQVEGSRGRFSYRIGRITVPGKVAKEDGEWRVSCCVRGQR
jgi:hypothetical protein